MFESNPRIGKLKLCQIDQKVEKIKDFLDEASDVLHYVST